MAEEREQEPAETISGGPEGDGLEGAFEPTPDPRSRAESVVDRLGARYWRKVLPANSSSYLVVTP